MKYKIGQKVKIKSNNLSGFYHYYKIGEIVNITNVYKDKLNCVNEKGRIQIVSFDDIEPILLEPKWKLSLK